MGWSDAKIQKAFALIMVALLAFLVVALLNGWHGRLPVSPWSVAIYAVVVLFAVWRAFRKSAPHA